MKKKTTAKKKNLRPFAKGEKNSSAKLTWPKVDKIRALYKKGSSTREIAKSYGVHHNTIHKIVSKVTWIKK